MVEMKRKPDKVGLARHACAALLVSLLIFGQAAAAQAAQKTVGVIMTGDIPFYKMIHQAFTDSMKGKGDIKYVIQSPAPEPMSWTNAARKLVVIGADMIVAYGAPATLTTMKETSSIPILFAGVYDPDSMRIAGKNATGISSKIPMDELLKGLKSIRDYKNLGVVFNKAEKDTILQVKEIKSFEGSLGFTMKLFNAGVKDYAKEISGVDAILMTTSCSGMCGINDVIGVARKQNLPTAATLSGGKGMVFTISADPTEQGRTLADMAAKVLGGAAPSSVPFRNPANILRIVNIKEASEVGVTVPGSLTGSATEVIR